MTQVQYCTFRLAGLTFGVDVRSVQEVLLSRQMTNMPLTSDVIAGLINLRGQIVTAIDLRRRLGIEHDAASEAGQMNVVVRNNDNVFSLIVDEIGDVVTVDTESFETPPETLTGPGRELITGTHKLDTGLLLVLDIAGTVTLDGLMARS